MWQTIKLPLGRGTTRQTSQNVLHAVEELYFLRRYGEAASFVRAVLAPGQGDGLDEETKRLLAYYERKCLEKVKTVVEEQAR
jgi:hypothetical protein